MKIRDMVFIALFSALIVIFTFISVPMPSGVPLTLQTFIIALTGYSLGSRKGAAAVGVYIAVGTVGVPVFSGMRGGLAVIFGVTGGFIAGFIPLVILCGAADGRVKKTICGFTGVLICHIIGTIRCGAVTGNFMAAFISSSLPYLPKDFICIIAAVAVSDVIRKAMQKFN